MAGVGIGVAGICSHSHMERERGMRGFLGSSRLSRVVLAVVMLAAGAGVGMGAMVAAQGNGEMYYACVNNSSGTIKMTSSTGTCATNELRIEWNKEGPQGIPGIPGAKGDQGEPGIDGSNGIDGVAGINCWDLNENGATDLASEDTNQDGVVNVIDCRGEKGDTGDFSGTFTSDNGAFSISVTDTGITLAGPSGQQIHMTPGSILVDGVTVTVESVTTTTISGSTTRIDGGTIFLNGSCSPVARVGDSVPEYVITSGSPSVLSC